jgi:DNA-binding transcriptional LysR family regulator
MDGIGLNSLKSLMIFKTLMENGTATKTARVLGITQSGVSRSLSQLEQNLGIQLFIRQQNRLLATPESHEVYNEVLRLISNLDELKHRVMALREFGASRVAIAAIPGLGFGFIPALIAKMQQHNPKLAIYLDLMSSHDVVHAVESEHYDIGFATQPIQSNQLVIEDLIKTKAVCLIPKNHPLARSDKIELNQLAGQHLVVANQPNIAADRLLNLVAENHIRIAGKTEANIGSVCGLVSNGIGISLVNSITAHDLANKNMVVKPFSPTVHYSFGMLYREKWCNNKIILTIRGSLPEMPHYLTS